MKKEFNFEKDKIGKLLLTFSLPCIISMLINSIYNIVDQVFIGQGVGYLGNAATNVIFPLVIIFTAVAQLIGNGCSASYSLRLGEKNFEEARKTVGSSILFLFLTAIGFSVLAYFFLPTLVNFFGCTKTVYPYAMAYGRIIICGAPFMIIYTGLSALIRADGAPNYSMACLVVGAIINLILDPIFIFGFHMGVQGGAYATIIGQIVSCLIACLYLFRLNCISLKKTDFRLHSSLLQTLGYGFSSFITQITVLVIFVVMNHLMTKYGASTKFGSDIPLSAFGIVSKLNQLFISMILGLSCGAQPIIGYNFGAGNYDRVKQTIGKVFQVAFFIGIGFNILFVCFPSQLVGLFGSQDNVLYMEFAKDCCRIFLLLSGINIVEISAGVLTQSLGNIKKAIGISVIRQILLFVPIVLILSSQFGLYGALFAEPVADFLACIIIGILFIKEYRKIGKPQKQPTDGLENPKTQQAFPSDLIITINREFGSGGHYVGKLLAEQLGIPFYDKELIHLVAQNSGLTESYIAEWEEKHETFSVMNTDYNAEDHLFLEESKVIEMLAKQGPCVIVGRCANYILRDSKQILRLYLYNTMEQKKKRVTAYYGVDSQQLEKTIQQMNKKRSAYYQYYTKHKWNDLSHYDLCFNPDTLGVEASATFLKELITTKQND